MTQDGRTRDTRRRTTYDILLFGILMVVLFLPLLQQKLLHIPLRPLNGVTLEEEQPEFSLEAYRSGDYAKQEEAYLGSHFGFREPIIRLYNQYLWNCYRKTYAHDVVGGKKNWLYYPESVRDYYGEEMLLWQPSVEEARNNFDLDVKYMNWVRTILKENNVELLAFMAPEKGALYPEYLPDQMPDTSTFNAREYFEQRFMETDFPSIEMTRWFQQMKDTVSYPLIPQTGAHWLFPAVYAADSLFRFMGDLKGVALPKLNIGPLHESDNHGADNDLEHLLNLLLPIRKHNGYSPTAEVTVTCDAQTVKPKVLFIGNSFMWGIVNHVHLREVFDNVEFWYYFSTAYSGEDLKETQPVVELNLLEKLLDFDYVVWFTTGNQMNKGTDGFAQAALLNLCVGDSLQKAMRAHLADSLKLVGSPNDLYTKTQAILLQHPEIIPGLNGDSLPTLRNPELRYAPYTKDIRKDSLWMAALETQAFLRTATLKTMLHAEAEHIMQGKTLYRDQKDEIQFGQQCRQEVEKLMEQMRGREETMRQVKEKAEKFNKPLEQALEDDAKWLIRQKYHLDRCRFVDDPDAEIPIPTLK
ncbi:MAG: hypothetical protein IJ057_09235 [Bacteroidales bacterium]|nr:hypothetical protein [Bacteroidales bacterium]